VQCLQLAFIEDWYWAMRKIPANLEWEPKSPKGSDESALIFLSGPADELESGELLFGQLINLAQEHLWIATPYFVPDEFVLNSLQLAALRGVDVRILVPGAKIDSRLAAWAGDSYFDELLASKVKISRYKRGFMHQKVLLADGVAAIGTANLDNRSMRINFEVTAVADSPALAASVRTMLENDFANSVPVTLDDWAKTPLLAQLRARAARVVAPLL
jgi:cardiolipin synthase